jgi:Thioesterase-like superfamily
VKPFSESTAVRELEDGVYGCGFDEEWNRERGAFGGVVVGVMVRALTHSVGDRARPLRSLTVHCTAPAQPGEAKVTTQVVKEGKTVTHLTARLEQGAQLIAFGTAVFGVTQPNALAYQTAELPPGVVDPETLTPAPAEHPLAPRFAKNFEYRYCLGAWAFFSGSQTTEVGGFIRPRVPGKLDAALACAMLDAWPTVAMMRAPEPLLTVTVDFNFQFFENFDGTRDAGPDDHLVHIHSRWAGDGYSEELRSLWGPDGKLLVQCRQNLAVLTAR